MPASALTGIGDQASKDWWEELGRTTLGSAGDTISVSFTARKYLRILVSVQASGSIDPWIRFNGDTGNNYNYRWRSNFTVDSTAINQPGSTISQSSTSADRYIEILVTSIASKEKIAFARVVEASTAGAGNLPTNADIVLKWANTSAQINSVTIFNNVAGSGDFASGSEVIVLGHD
jgi:hypothetical protein